MFKELDIRHIVYQAIDLMNIRSVKTFSLPPHTYIGAGSVSCIGQALVERGITCVFIVVDEIIDQLKLAEPMYRSLSQYNINYVNYIQPAGEPESKIVEDAIQKFIASSCDGIVAIGGGSALDAAKAIALLSAHPYLGAVDLLNPENIKNKRVPFIAVPTTAGTGSEATNVAVITDSVSRAKQVIVHSDLIPDLALIDACLMLQLPAHVTAATGIDALTHAVEAYIATKSTPLTRALAYQALRTIGDFLPVATGQGSNLEAREAMALASYMAGVAFSNAGLGLTHSMAHQIGARYHIPHGVANAIMLPSVMVFNELVCKRDFADIGLSLTGEIMSSASVIHFIQKMIVDLGLPANLSEVGAVEKDFEMMAEKALQDYCITTNPRLVSKTQVIRIYQHAFSR